MTAKEKIQQRQQEFDQRVIELMPAEVQAGQTTLCSRSGRVIEAGTSCILDLEGRVFWSMFQFYVTVHAELA